MSWSKATTRWSLQSAARRRSRSGTAREDALKRQELRGPTYCAATSIVACETPLFKSRTNLSLPRVRSRSGPG